MTRIQILDVSARDGLQNEPNAATLTVDDKLEYIRLLIEAGLTRIEAGSFVKPSAVPAMANSAELAEKLRPISLSHPEVIFSYLVPNLKGLERAKAMDAKEVAVFLALSEKFSQANINAGVDASFEAIRPVVQQALALGMRVRGYISNLFGYDDLPFSPHEVARRSKQLLNMGCYELSLGDTTGIGQPEQVQELMQVFKTEELPIQQIAMHFHDTFGNAIRNVDMSYQHGIRTFDASTGGLGGCPYANSPKGNLAMEDLVRWCHERCIQCDVTDAGKLVDAARFIRRKLGK